MVVHNNNIRFSSQNSASGHEGSKAHLDALYELKTAAGGVGSCTGSVGVVIHEADSPIVVLVNDFVCLSVFYCGLRLTN